MNTENPLWGAPRMHGELLKLGFDVAESTVSKYMTTVIPELERNGSKVGDHNRRIDDKQASKSPYHDPGGFVRPTEVRAMKGCLHRRVLDAVRAHAGEAIEPAAALLVSPDSRLFRRRPCSGRDVRFIARPRPDPYVRLSRIRLLPWGCDGPSCRIRSSAFDARAWL